MVQRRWVESWSDWQPRLLSVLRVVAAFLFMQPGAMKLFGYPMAMPTGHPARLLTEPWIGGLLEVCGGALLVLGLFTRPVAFVLSGEMAVAYFQFHAPKGFWPLVNNGMNAVLFCFVWLYLSAAGGGAWSLDALRGRSGARPAQGAGRPGT